MNPISARISTGGCAATTWSQREEMREAGADFFSPKPRSRVGLRGVRDAGVGCEDEARDANGKPTCLFRCLSD